MAEPKKKKAPSVDYTKGASPHARAVLEIIAVFNRRGISYDPDRKKILRTVATFLDVEVIEKS